MIIINHIIQLHFTNKKVTNQRLKNIEVLHFKRKYSNDAYVVTIIENNSSYYPDVYRQKVPKPEKPTALISNSLVFRIQIYCYFIRYALHFVNSHESKDSYYAQPNTVISTFLLDPESAKYSLKQYKAEVMRKSGWKPARVPNPISKQDYVNESLQIIKEETYKIKTVKNIYKPYTFDIATGSHINRPQSPTIKIAYFILLTTSLTETSLHFSFITTLINRINTWFKNHPNTFYDRYKFAIEVRLIFNSSRAERRATLSNPFPLTHHPRYVQNRMNHVLIEKLKEFKDLLKGVSNNGEDENEKLSLLYKKFQGQISPYLKDDRSALSLVPYPSERSLPFYGALFSQCIEEITCRVRKKSDISLTCVELIRLGQFNQSLVPFNFPQGSSSAQYNLNAFLFLTKDDLILLNSHKPSTLVPEKPSL